MVNEKVLLIWHREEVVPNSHKTVVYTWNGYETTENWQSIPAYMETHADILRNQYIQFINNLTDKNIEGKKLVNHFDIGHGYNLWWMSTLFEKSTFKSPRLLDCIKVLALDMIVQSEAPCKIIYSGSDKIISKTLENLSNKRQVPFEWQKNKIYKINFSLKTIVRTIYELLPVFIQGLISVFFFVYKHWNLTTSEKTNWYEGNEAVFFFSYFIHLNEAKCKKGEFYSHFWEILPQRLVNSGLRLNWAHLFLFSSTVPTVSVGKKWLTSFNNQPKKNGVHAFLESFLTFKLIARCFLNYMRVTFTSLLLTRKDLFEVSDSNVNLWYLLKKDWSISTKGKEAFMNIIWVELFESFLAAIPKQKLGLFLHENQNWERAFVHAWKRHNHGILIGFSHSTVRYWDIRYFENSIDFNGQYQFPGCPKPDFIAINGEIAQKAFLESGTQPSYLRQVEALRYLENSQPVGLERPQREENQVKKIKILLIGDIMRETTTRILDIIEKVSPALSNRFSFSFKEHPGCPIDVSKYQFIDTGKIHEPLKKILRQYNCVVGSISSGCLEAYIYSLKVFVFLDPYQFNLSPLRGVQGVNFFSSTSELEHLFMHNCQQSSNVNVIVASNQVFWSDVSLPRWKNLFSSLGYELQ